MKESTESAVPLAWSRVSPTDIGPMAVPARNIPSLEVKFLKL